MARAGGLSPLDIADVAEEPEDYGQALLDLLGSPNMPPGAGSGSSTTR
jgi:hypothetical protein